MLGMPFDLSGQPPSGDCVACEHCASDEDQLEGRRMRAAVMAAVSSALGRTPPAAAA